MLGYALLLFVCAFGWTAESRETAVLGGPCLPRETIGPEWNEVVAQQLQQERRGNHEAAFALAKQVVRANCSNEHWWFRLAEAAVNAGHSGDALSVLAVMHGRRINGIRQWLDDPKSPLHGLAQSNEFRSSRITQILERDRSALEKRRAAARARMAAEPHPPETYVAKGACPFECCGYGAWTVERDVELVDAPNGKRTVGRAAKGEKIEALTGEVHLRPRPTLVRFNGPEPAGAIVYLLDYLGEGVGHYWSDGKVKETDMRVEEECTFPGKGCWGEFLFPEDANWVRDAVWWVKIKTRRGVIGWTRQTSRFSGADRCG